MGESNLLQNLGGTWAACVPCMADIDSGKAHRVVDRAVRRMGVHDIPFAHAETSKLHQAFLSGRQPGRILLTTTAWPDLHLSPRNLPKVRDRLAQFYRGPDDLPDTLPIARRRDQLADSLDRARLYWVDNDFTDLAEHAASQMPAVTASRDLMPCDDGLLVWSRATTTRRITAASWSSQDDVIQVVNYRAVGTGLDDQPMQRLRDEVGWLAPMRAVQLRHEQLVDDAHDHGSAILLTTWLLIAQKAAETVPAEVEKTVRKRYARAKRPLPDVRIVRIRSQTKREDTASTTTTGTGRTYTSRVWSPATGATSHTDQAEPSGARSTSTRSCDLLTALTACPTASATARRDAASLTGCKGGRVEEDGSGSELRDVGSIVVARIGCVRATGDISLPWAVADGAGVAVGPVSEFLRNLLACGSSPASCRSYGYDLLRWFRFLAAVGVAWNRAQRSEVRDFVLWLRSCHNPARDRRRASSPAPGSINPRTGKAYLRDGYAPATINHAISVIAEFYDYHLRSGTGPVVSPVPPRRYRGSRMFAHRNPMEPYKVHRRGPLRQKQPELQPRAVPDDVLDDLFADLDCNRDRALFSMFLSSGARAAELLGMTVSDAHPGDGRIYVQGKGWGGAKQACPASPEAFAWLALYLGELAQQCHRPEPDEPLWWTRRNPLRPLTYTALRAVLRRVNERIGANVTIHDLRHTLCLRLVNDPNISLVDAQQVMRHRHITTTSGYVRARIDEVIAKLQEHYARPRQQAAPLVCWQYAQADLDDVFGGR